MNPFIKQAYHSVWLGTAKKPVAVDGMLVHPQTTNWSCGPMALRFCFMKHGFDISEHRIAKLALASTDGTSSRHMEFAALRLGFRWRLHQANTAREAKQAMQQLLRQGLPLVLVVDKDKHWIAALHFSRRGWLVFDSACTGPVITLCSWTRLQKRLRHRPKGQAKPTYVFASVARRVQHLKKDL